MARNITKTAQNQILEVEQASQKIQEEVLGLICTPGMVRLGCRGNDPGEPGKILTTLTPDGKQAGWKAVFAAEGSQAATTYLFQYFGQKIDAPDSSLTWLDIFQLLSQEIKLPPGGMNRFLDDRNEYDAAHFVSDTLVSSCGNLKYLQYAPGFVRADESMDHFTEQVELIPDAFPNLELISLDYEFHGSIEEAADYVPFLTPVRIQLYKPDGGPGDPHNRVLCTMVSILASMKHLKHVLITFGGGRW